MKFAIILATLLAVSAAYTCRTYYRLNGRDMFDHDPYCYGNTTCATVHGAAISHDYEYFDLEVKGCFTCKDAYENEGNSTDFHDLEVYECYECEGDYCNDHDDEHSGVATVTASAAVAIPLYLWL